MNKILLCAQRLIPLYGYEKALYFFLCALRHRKLFAQWLDYLDTQLPACTSELTRIRLAMRPAYRYIRPALTPFQKMAIIAYYYTALKTRLSPDGVTKLLTGRNLVAELTGRSGRKYTVTLIAETGKDGALKLLLMDTHANIALAMITGIIGVDKDKRPAFWIGSIQGTHPPAGKEEIAYATKDLNNLRPKQAVFYAACALAEWFGIQTMLGPSLGNQIAMKVFYRKHKIYNDYNSFWEEFTDVREGGDYRISLPLSRRAASEVSSKRRKDWLLRYERIDAMSAGVKAALDALR